MLTIQVKITGNEQLIAKLRRLNLGLLDFTEPLKAIGEELKSYYSNQVFASQGGVLGVRWPTLAASTMLYKAKHYAQYATVPLIRTGTMKDNFKSTVTPRTLAITNPTPYFVYHQSSAARTKIPYRPMMGINQDAKEIVERILRADIQALIEGA